MGQFDLQSDSPFFRAFTTRVPFRDGLLECLSYIEILRLGQTCKSLLEDRDKWRYLDIIGIATGNHNWVRHMRRQGFKLLLIGPSNCDTPMKFIKYTRLGKTLLFVLSKNDLHLLHDEDIVQELKRQSSTLDVFSYDGFDTFMARSVQWETKEGERPRPHGLFKIPHHAAMQQTFRSVLNWRPTPGWGGDTGVFETPKKGTKYHVLHSGALLCAPQIEAIEWCEISQERLKALVESGDSKLPVLVYKPIDWDSGSERCSVAAAL